MKDVEEARSDVGRYHALGFPTSGEVERRRLVGRHLIERAIVLLINADRFQKTDLVSRCRHRGRCATWLASDPLQGKEVD